MLWFQDYCSLKVVCVTGDFRIVESLKYLANKKSDKNIPKRVRGGGVHRLRRRRTTGKEKEEKEKENILFWWGREMMKNKEGYIWSGKIFDLWRRYWLILTDTIWPMPPCINATIFIIKDLQYNFPKLRGGRLDFFQKFIRFGSGTLPLGIPHTMT